MLKDKNGKELQPGDIVTVRIRLDDSVFSHDTQWMTGVVVGPDDQEKMQTWAWTQRITVHQSCVEK